MSRALTFFLSLSLLLSLPLSTLHACPSFPRRMSLDHYVEFFYPSYCRARVAGARAIFVSEEGNSFGAPPAARPTRAAPHLVVKRWGFSPLDPPFNGRCSLVVLVISIHLSRSVMTSEGISGKPPTSTQAGRSFLWSHPKKQGFSNRRVLQLVWFAKLFETCLTRVLVDVDAYLPNTPSTTRSWRPHHRERTSSSCTLPSSGHLAPLHRTTFGPISSAPHAKSSVLISV